MYIGFFYLQAYLLRRDVERDCPEVDTPVRVYAGDDAEDAGPFRASLSQSAETKDHCPLVLCHNLKVKHEFTHSPIHCTGRLINTTLLGCAEALEAQALRQGKVLERTPFHFFGSDPRGFATASLSCLRTSSSPLPSPNVPNGAQVMEVPPLCFYICVPSYITLDPRYLDAEAEGEGHGDDDEQNGESRQNEGSDARIAIVGCKGEEEREGRIKRRPVRPSGTRREGEAMCEKSTQRITAGVISHFPSPLSPSPILFGRAARTRPPFRLCSDSLLRGESIRFSVFAQRASEIEGAAKMTKG